LSAAEQLKRLHELQQIDQKIMEVERFRDEAPKRVHRMETDIQQHQAIITDREAVLKTAREERRAKEKELEEHEARITKNQERLMNVKTNEEFRAIQKENQRQKEMIEELEDQILRIMDDIDSAELGVKKAKERFAELESDVQKQIADLQAKLAQVEAELVELNAQREERLPNIDSTFLARYDKLRKITGGVAVVRVENRTCQGCRMNVPPQVYNLVIRNEEIITCPNCYRILFFEAEADQAAGGET